MTSFCHCAAGQSGVPMEKLRQNTHLLSQQDPTYDYPSTVNAHLEEDTVQRSTQTNEQSIPQENQFPNAQEGDLVYAYATQPTVVFLATNAAYNVTTSVEDGSEILTSTNDAYAVASKDDVNTTENAAYGVRL